MSRSKRITRRTNLSALRTGAAGVVLLLAAVSPLLAAGADTPQREGTMTANVARETSEWSNIWWDCANDPTLPRVLLIGDSISCGYSPVVTKLLQGKVHVDRLGTSNSLGDPLLFKQTQMMLEAYSYAAVHFNNGLHGFHLPGEAYSAALRDWVKLIRAHGRGAKLIWAASTPITKSRDVKTLSDSNGIVTTRNTLAAAIMQEEGIPVNDLYGLVVGKPELRSPDGYHYNADGYALLGKAVADSVLPGH